MPNWQAATVPKVLKAHGANVAVTGERSRGLPQREAGAYTSDASAGPVTVRFDESAAVASRPSFLPEKA